MRYLIDSDWIIDCIAGIPDAVQAIERHRALGIAVSTIAVGEVYEGAYLFPNPAARLDEFRRFLDGFTVLAATEPVVEIFARVRAQLRRQGNLIPDLDLLIASTALAHDLIVMTRNVRHFGRVPGLQLYHPS